jgi:hypothetical protein
MLAKSNKPPEFFDIPAVTVDIANADAVADLFTSVFSGPLAIHPAGVMPPALSPLSARPDEPQQSEAEPARVVPLSD